MMIRAMLVWCTFIARIVTLTAVAGGWRRCAEQGSSIENLYGGLSLVVTELPPALYLHYPQGRGFQLGLTRFLTPFLGFRMLRDAVAPGDPALGPAAP